jgi:hypothetical protein
MVLLAHTVARNLLKTATWFAMLKIYAHLVMCNTSPRRVLLILSSSERSRKRRKLLKASSPKFLALDVANRCSTNQWLQDI